MKTTTARVLAGLLLITLVAAGLIYKQFLDANNRLETLKGQMKKSHLQSAQVIDAGEKIIKDLQAGIEQSTADIAALKKSESQNQATILNLQKTIEQKEQVLATTRQTGMAQISRLENELADLEQTHTLTLERVEQLNRNRESDQNKIRQLEQTNQKSAQIIDAGEKTIKDLQEDIEQSAADIAALKKIERQHQATILNLQKTIEQKEQMLATTRQTGMAQISRLKNELADLKQTHTLTLERVEQLNRDRESDQNKIRQLEQTNQQSVQVIDAREKAIKGLQESIRQSEDMILALNSKKQALEENTSKTLLQQQNMKNTYDQLIRELRHELGKKEATIEKFEKQLTVVFVDRILFPFGRASLSENGKETLSQMGKVLKKNPNSNLSIVGHTDNVPISKGYRYKFPSNWELSAARASSVARFFQEVSAIDPTRIKVVGKSFHEPLADNTTPQGRAKNRRVEIIITPGR